MEHGADTTVWSVDILCGVVAVLSDLIKELNEVWEG
jgi:hypothetical protein